MMLESLLLSQDAEVLRVLRPTLEKLSIEVEVCQDAKKAVEIPLAEKFDAVIVDCDDLQGGLQVLEGLRATPSNKNSVSFALLNGGKTTTQTVFNMGANFVLQKPISTVNAARCFHAALNFMVREQRRYYRQPVKMTVKVATAEKELKAISTNISEGGIALILHPPLTKNAISHLQFTLPETTLPLNLQAETAWTDVNGNIGLRFVKVPANSQAQIENWLGQHTEKSPRVPDGRPLAAAPSSSDEPA
jgi:DNA-binding response OmpR family regulator